MLKITPIDEKAAEQGIWRKYMGVSLLIARANNNKFKKAFRRLSAPFEKQMDKGKLQEDDAEEILCQSMAEGVLLGWKNYKDGEMDIHYSTSKAKELLVNDPDCRDFIQEVSNDLDNYLTENIEVIAEK